MSAQITLNIPDKALENFKKVIKSECNVVVDDVVKVLTTLLQRDIDADLDGYAFYSISVDDINEDFPGILKED